MSYLYDSVKRTYDRNLQILQSKNHDYAGPEEEFLNFIDSAEFAEVSVEQGLMVRISDKLTRAKNLMRRPAAVWDEKLEDTLADAINYLAILKAWRERPLK